MTPFVLQSLPAIASRSGEAKAVSWKGVQVMARDDALALWNGFNFYHVQCEA